MGSAFFDLPKKNPPHEMRSQRVIPMLERSELKKPLRPIASAAELVHYSLYDYIGKRSTESFLAVYLNAAAHVVGFSEYGSGSTTMVAATPSGIFREALLVNADAIMTVHQHPTGDARPSDADERMWRRLMAIGELLQIPVVDNIVLGEDEFYSEAENRMTSYARLRIMMP